LKLSGAYNARVFGSPRYVAMGCALMCLAVGLGPAQAEPAAPTWHDLFPGLPGNPAAHAEGPAITDGRHSLARLRPGVYMTMSDRPDRCRYRAELTREFQEAVTRGMVLRAEASTPPVRGPQYLIVNDDAEETLAAFIFSGGCQWKRVGSPQDAQRWFKLSR
jgi:hypothetical protein